MEQQSDRGWVMDKDAAGCHASGNQGTLSRGKILAVHVRLQSKRSIRPIHRGHVQDAVEARRPRRWAACGMHVESFVCHHHCPAGACRRLEMNVSLSFLDIGMT